MSIFKLSIDNHHGHFGETEAAERAVIGRVLADVAHAVGTGRPFVGPQTIILNGTAIGSYSFGEDAHNFVKSDLDKALDTIGGEG